MNRARLFWFILAAIGAGLILLIVNDSGGSTLGLPNDSFANLVYLGVWGTVLAVGIHAAPGTVRREEERADVAQSSDRRLHPWSVGSRRARLGGGRTAPETAAA